MAIAEEWLGLSDGSRMRLRCVTPDGPIKLTLIFQHGAAGDGSIYRSIARTYALSGIQTFLLDLRGHGQSDGIVGDVPRPDQYARDFAEGVRLLRPRCIGPTIIGGHSSGANIVLCALPHLTDVAIAGYLLVAPTFSGDHRFVRDQGSSLGRSLRLAFGLRYFLKFDRPQSLAKGNIRFSLVKFALSLVGVRRNARVLWFRPYATTEPYGYTARAVLALMLLDFEAKLLMLRKPVMLMLAERDEFVESRAIALAFRWGLPPDTPLELVLSARGGHFSALSLSAGPIRAWCAAQFSSTSPAEEARHAAS